VYRLCILFDIICEKVPYRGTNSVVLYQLFSHACDSVYG